MLRNTLEQWGPAAKALHWLVVLLVLGQFVLASIAEDLPLGTEKIATLARHKSLGITILLLSALRVLWRFANPTPAPPAAARRWERTLASAVHVGLYATLFLLPLSGWMMSSARNFPVSWFGLVQLPDLVDADPRTFERMHDAHELLATLLVVLAATHVAGALHHHFLHKDDVLRRMLPFTMPRGR
jgi:cytochrome b561